MPMIASGRVIWDASSNKTTSNSTPESLLVWRAKGVAPMTYPPLLSPNRELENFSKFGTSKSPACLSSPILQTGIVSSTLVILFNALWIARWVRAVTNTRRPSATSKRARWASMRVLPVPGGPWIRCSRSVAYDMATDSIWLSLRPAFCNSFWARSYRA